MNQSMSGLKLVAWGLLSITAWSFGSPARAQSQMRVLTPEERRERNYELAMSIYNAYVVLPEVGYADGWKKGDLAPGCVFGHFTPIEPKSTDKHPNILRVKKRKWSEEIITDDEDFKDVNKPEYTYILSILPDYRIRTPFTGFCDVKGCSAVYTVGGHDKSGEYFELSEIFLFWTNEYGKVIRQETYDDWNNMPRFMSRITGVPIKDPATDIFSKFKWDYPKVD